MQTMAGKSCAIAHSAIVVEGFLALAAREIQGGVGRVSRRENGTLLAVNHISPWYLWFMALTYNILEGLGGVGLRARGAGHAPARACAHGWAVCPHSLDLKTRRQASLARDRARVP